MIEYIIKDGNNGIVVLMPAEAPSPSGGMIFTNYDTAVDVLRNSGASFPAGEYTIAMRVS
jgi:hypothetical protein